MLKPRIPPRASVLSLAGGSHSLVGDKTHRGNMYPEADKPRYSSLTYWPLFQASLFGTTNCSL